MLKQKKATKDKVCEKCGGRLFILTKEGTVECECREDYLTKLRLNASGIPRRFKNKTVNSFKGRDKKTKDLRSFANSYIKCFNPRIEGSTGLLFMGGTGCGKTHLAIGIMRAIIEKGFTGHYCNMVDFFALLRDSYGGDVDYDEMDMIDRATSVDILVMDDIGAEKPSLWMLDRLYNVVNRRYESNLPILVTTNKLDIKDLEDHVGKRVVSRLCEMCQILDSEFPDIDYRMKGLDFQVNSVRKKSYR
jgi:DNA replication protein DnaC